LGVELQEIFWGSRNGRMGELMTKLEAVNLTEVGSLHVLE
jgi:hypothetical protein